MKNGKMETPRQNKNMMNVGLKSMRDELQGTDILRWAGGGLEEGWRRVGGGWEEDRRRDWRRIGGGLEEDWRKTGGGLEEAWRIGGGGLEHPPTTQHSHPTEIAPPPPPSTKKKDKQKQ